MKRVRRVLLLLVTFELLASSQAIADDIAQDAATCAGQCHNIKPYAEGLKNPDLLVSQHAKAGIGCADCHEQNDEIRKQEQAAYDSGDYETPMYTREFETDFCFRCHGSYDELAKRTEPLVKTLGRNPHKSHMGEVDCYECHKVHQASTFVCSECHFSKWEELLPPGWEIKH